MDCIMEQSILYFNTTHYQKRNRVSLIWLIFNTSVEPKSIQMKNRDRKVSENKDPKPAFSGKPRKKYDAPDFRKEETTPVIQVQVETTGKVWTFREADQLQFQEASHKDSSPSCRSGPVQAMRGAPASLFRPQTAETPGVQQWSRHFKYSDVTNTLKIIGGRGTEPKGKGLMDMDNGMVIEWERRVERD